MNESSKYANWLLITLLITLLLSSLILGWLLANSPVLAYPQLSNSAQHSQTNLAANIEPLTNTNKPVKALKNTQPDSTSANFSFSILASQPQLDQAALTPAATLPLASLAANTLNPDLPKTAAPLALTTQSLNKTTPPKTGWIYAGQFQKGEWSLVSLKLTNNQLPLPSTSYPLAWGTNVRTAPPGTRMNSNNQNLAKHIDYLAEGSEIQVLTVKPSGKNGHIWLEISYGE